MYTFYETILTLAAQRWKVSGLSLLKCWFFSLQLVALKVVCYILQWLHNFVSVFYALSIYILSMDRELFEVLL